MTPQSKEKPAFLSMFSDGTLKVSVNLQAARDIAICCLKEHEVFDPFSPRFYEFFKEDITASLNDQVIVRCQLKLSPFSDDKLIGASIAPDILSALTQMFQNVRYRVELTYRRVN